MPVISPRRSTSTTSGSLYIPQTTSGTYSSSLANKSAGSGTLSSSSTSGYSSTYRSNGLTKTPSASTYSSYYTGSYLSRTSAYPSVGRSTYSSTSSSALTGGSSALSSYRPSSYLSGGNNDTTASSSRFGVSNYFTNRLSSRDTTPPTTTTTSFTNRRRRSLLANRLLSYSNSNNYYNAAAANTTKPTQKYSATTSTFAYLPKLLDGDHSSNRRFYPNNIRDRDPTSNSEPFSSSSPSSTCNYKKNLSSDHDTLTSHSDHSTNYNFNKFNNNEYLSKTNLNSPPSKSTTKSIIENNNNIINNNNNKNNNTPSSSKSSSSINTTTTIIDDQSNIKKNSNKSVTPQRDLDLRTGTENTDCNNNNNSNTKSPRSSSKSRNSRVSSSYSSSSLARLVATSALDIYEKYSPAHYIPKCELSRSSSLSEGAASAATANAANSSTALNDTNNKNSSSNSISKSNSYTKRYSRQTNGTINENTEAPTSISSAITDSYLSVPHSNSNNNLNNSNGGNANKLLLHVSYDLQDDSNSLRDLKISCISPTTTTTTTSSPSSQDTKDTAQLAIKQKRSVEATTTTTTTTTTTAAAATTLTTTTNNTTSNPSNNQSTTTATAAKPGNQHFFLTLKDQNFLKKECDLARSQVYRSKQRFENNNGYDDNFNNNNDNSNNNNHDGSNNANNNENGSPPLAGSNSSIVNAINDNRKLPGANKQQPSIKPLIHRIPNNKLLTKIPANNNMHCLHSNSELLDDIKYIDSDDTERQQQQQQQQQQQSQQQQRQHKPKLRPKSSIISTSNQSLFEKVNQYKYQNGTTLSSSPPVSSSAPTSTAATATSSPSSTLPLMGGRKRDIIHDTFSIKASIEKFNTLSEAKRLPTRNSTTNLQLSNDYERRLPLRERSASPATSSSTATTRGSSITSNLAASNSTSSGSITSNNLLLRNRSTESSPSHSPKNLRKTSVTPTAALLNGSTSNLLKSGATYDKVTLTTVSMLSCPTPTLSTVTSRTILNEKKPPASASPSNKLTDIDESVRNTSSLRSGLPPISPTPSRHWDRDSSRSSILSSRNLSDDYSSSSKLSSSATLDDKPEQEGLCGLRNIGNTCFMNSVIQCLSHTSELTKFLKTQNGVRSSSSKDQQILSEFAKLIREMWTSNVNSVTPSELKRAFSSKHRMYSDYNQQDAQEFLRFFLDSLHCALNTGVKGDILKIDENLSDNKKADITWEWYAKAENSVIRDLFVGQLKSTLRCTVCGNTSVTFDPFWDLSVPLPSSSRCKLESCLDLFIREEVLDGDEMPTCSKCQTRRKSTKSFTIQRFPKYLVIHLKRFSETRWSKLSNIVEFPTGERELNMGPYASNSSTHAYYTLYAISNHMGSTAGGHYVALCKHPITKKWHEFNDNIVSGELSESHLVSSSAYILFYERAHRRGGEDHGQAINFLSQRKMQTVKRKYYHDHTVSSSENYRYRIDHNKSTLKSIYHDSHNNIFVLNTFLGMLFYAIFFTSCYYLFFKPAT